MFEKLLELERHLRNYFPTAYIHLSVAIDAHQGRSSTEFWFGFKDDGVDKSEKFTCYSALVDYVQKFIFAECMVMNRKIESDGYLKRMNLN